MANIKKTIKNEKIILFERNNQKGRGSFAVFFFFIFLYIEVGKVFITSIVPY